MVTETPDRRWRLQVWDRKKNPIYDGTCVGDAELNATLRPLEARSDFGRFSVTPEARIGDRPAVEAEPAPPTYPPDWPCRECARPRVDCERTDPAVSGHEFIPTARL